MSLKKSFNRLVLNAWQNNAAWLKLLRPLSLVYGVVVAHKTCTPNNAYRAPVPVWVIGNIAVGGAGKTPLIIALVALLQARGVGVGVIARGYGNKLVNHEAIFVDNASDPAQVGDEPCLIVQATGVPMAVSPNRCSAIECVLAHAPDVQLILSDDGLQHYALIRDVEWIVVDVARGFGNKKLLPEGFLREPLSRLDGAFVVYHETPSAFAQKIAQTDNAARAMMTLKVGTPYLLSQMEQVAAEDSACCAPNIVTGLALDSSAPFINSPIQVADGQNVYALTGIGYPDRFFATVRALGFIPIECPLPDHHVFVASDFMPFLRDNHGDNLPIFITEKDAVKVRRLLNAPDFAAKFAARIWVVPVAAMLNEAATASALAVLQEVGVLDKS